MELKLRLNGGDPPYTLVRMREVAYRFRDYNISARLWNIILLLELGSSFRRCVYVCQDQSGAIHD